MPKRTSRSHWIIIALAAAVLLCVAGGYGTFGSSYVCPECGASRHTSELQFPFVHDATIFTYSDRIVPTPLSTAAVESRCLIGHKHTWKFVNGGGNGVRCALGSGQEAYQNAIDPINAEFIRNIGRCGTSEEARQWLNKTLSGRFICTILLGEEYPESGIADCEEFRRWLDQHAAGIDEQMALYERNR